MDDGMSVPGTKAFRETLETFGRHGSLAGIITRPSGEGSSLPVVLLGAGIIHKVGPSRASVELARALASAGHPTLRFDLSGIGDSPRVDEPAMDRTAVLDIQDAVSLMEERFGGKDGVALVGFCSGADNGLFVAAEDPRVTRLVLFDPTVHRTRGFDKRRMTRRLTSARSWWNLISGRSLALELKDRMVDESDRPPGYYGLLTQSPEDTDRRVGVLVERGVRILYVLSRGCHAYCNSPEQVAESLPNGYSPDRISVLWAPEMDHILSTRPQREVLAAAVGDHLADRRLRRLEVPEPRPSGPRTRGPAPRRYRPG
jgi:pimeloyl-ACP methyl ester carboxylesterase